MKLRKPTSVTLAAVLGAGLQFASPGAASAQDPTLAQEVEAREIAFAKTMADR